jgi:tetratricopeptide (TPR) repeat protein
MSNKVIAALIAALTLAACEETPSTPVRVIPSKAPVALEVLAPMDSGTPVAVLPDAGRSDTLAIAHDSPSFDHLARSQQLVLDGDARGALVEARRALYSTPEDEDTLLQIAKLSRRVKQYQLSAEAWGRLGALKPSDPSPMLQQGKALLELKDYAGAIAAGREAVARDEGNPEGYQLTGLAQLSANELSGAIASFEKAVELAPSHGWALNNLGFAYLRANENEQAVKVLEKASGLLPAVAAVQNNLGVALERVGRGDEAKAAYQHAMDLSPKYVKARINAARLARVQLPADDSQSAPDSMSDIPADAHPVPGQ